MKILKKEGFGDEYVIMYQFILGAILEKNIYFYQKKMIYFYDPHQ